MYIYTDVCAHLQYLGPFNTIDVVSGCYCNLKHPETKYGTFYKSSTRYVMYIDWTPVSRQMFPSHDDVVHVLGQNLR